MLTPISLKIIRVLVPEFLPQRTVLGNFKRKKTQKLFAVIKYCVEGNCRTPRQDILRFELLCDNKRGLKGTLLYAVHGPGIGAAF